MPNPFLGVVFHWAGGLASGSFYVPFRGVRRWSWETAWLTGGFFSWILAPWLFASLLTRDLLAVLTEAFHQHGTAVFWTWFFGALWGLGGLTFGMTMRYLGMSLGMAVALGYCSAFGTLVPPAFDGTFAAKLITPLSGNWVLTGIGVCLLGIVVAGVAGVLKERGMTEEEKREAVKEFNFWKGLGVATFSGVMSACFSFGLAAGKPITELTKTHGTDSHWGGLPVLVVLLFGGFVANAVWCAILHARNGTGREYLTGHTLRASTGGFLNEHGAAHGGEHIPAGAPVPLLRNWAFSALAGVTWYLQFFFYTIGESMMGDYTFSSWTLHMASIIIFSSLWGIGLKEWRGASRSAFGLLLTSLAILVLSTVVIGYGNFLGQSSGGH